MKRIVAFALLLAAVLAGPIAAQAPDPLVREGATRKLTDHVYAIPDFRTPLVPNVGIIVGSRATLVVDTGLGPRNGEIVLKEVAKVSKTKENYLVTTHVHPEHDLGASAFRGWTLIRSKDQEADIAAQGLSLAQAFSRRSPVTAELLKGAEFRKADVVFDKEHSLDLGGVKVRIMAMGLNHTLGDTAVWVEPDRVLFSGDVTMKTQPNPAQGSTLAHWIQSLDRYQALKPLHVVGAHADLGGPELIQGYKDYLALVKRRAGELKAQGKTQAEATQILSAELKDRYPDAGRLGGAVRLAWNAP
jgi:glyoxylase-like metal-dependent hydrolase (beta-lactamase superfamily II)